MTEAPQLVRLKADDKDLNLRRAMTSPEFYAHFCAGDERTWWFDLRRKRHMLGARPLADADFARIKFWLLDTVAVESSKSTGGTELKPMSAPVQAITELALMLAYADQRDEVFEYLDGLRGTWDGVKRTAELAAALGLSSEGETHVLEAELVWLRKFLVSAVARALKPGCQVDCALVLVGAQGLGKSSSLRLLFGDEWVHESAINLGDKDSAAVMSRAWCVELAELASMRRAKDVEEVKHFLTVREDAYRAPYERLTQTYPRRAVIVGTTNDMAPFSDPTGNRRFWPVRVTGKARREWLLSMRNAVWAEAVAAFDAGEPWWLDEPEALTHSEVVETYTQQDEWVELLTPKLAAEDSVRLADVAAEHLGILERDLDRSTQLRLASVLRAIGFERHKNGAGRIVWRRL